VSEPARIQEGMPERRWAERPRRTPWWLAVAVSGLILGPYAVLVLLSLGSGWTFPRLVPDRLDFMPWRNLLADKHGLSRAILTSLGLSLAVAILSTAGGLVAGRALRRTTFGFWRFAAYLPFVISPVIAGVVLYDMLVRLRLAGTAAGVILVQVIFATAFASVYFSELWSPRTDRLESLVKNLGGGTWQVWRHAVLPQAASLITVCLLQTALFSWLDYGLISVVGGGQVETITMRVFAYIREASVNQAAAASLVLVGPALAICLGSGLLLWLGFASWEKDR
jgi:putative spermidine/putrescine transport system permease protein